MISRSPFGLCCLIYPIKNTSPGLLQSFRCSALFALVHRPKLFQKFPIFPPFRRLVRWAARDDPRLLNNLSLVTAGLSLVYEGPGDMDPIVWCVYVCDCRTWARFLSLARSKLRLCSANHRAGYFSNLACDWLSIVWAYSKQRTENGPWL